MEHAGIEKKRKMHRFVIPYPVYKPISLKEIKIDMEKNNNIKKTNHLQEQSF